MAFSTLIYTLIFGVGYFDGTLIMHVVETMITQVHTLINNVGYVDAQASSTLMSSVVH
jgi:hypothetical protein